MAINADVLLADLKRVALKRGCQAILSAGPDNGDALAANDDRNFQLIVKKTIHPDFWHFCASSTAAGTCEKVLELAQDISLARQTIFSAARGLQCDPDVAKYVLAHLHATRRFLKLNLTEKNANSSAPRHLNRLLDGLSGIIRQTNIYLAN